MMRMRGQLAFRMVTQVRLRMHRLASCSRLLFDPLQGQPRSEYGQMVTRTQVHHQLADRGTGHAANQQSAKGSPGQIHHPPAPPSGAQLM
ncbi:hypothetical protein D9M69_400780 [compost metagenome]